LKLSCCTSLETTKEAAKPLHFNSTVDQTVTEQKVGNQQAIIHAGIAPWH
jgi:hypothetical protein